MSTESIQKILINFIGHKIGLYLNNGRSVEGRLIKVKSDHIVILINFSVFYFDLNQLQAISKNAKYSKKNDDEINHEDKSIFYDIIASLKYRWVTINSLNNQIFTGLLSRITDDYVLLINNEDQIFIPMTFITNITEGIVEEEKVDLTTHSDHSGKQEDKQKKSIPVDDVSEAQVLDDPHKSNLVDEKIESLVIDNSHESRLVEEVIESHALEGPQDSTIDEELTNSYILDDSQESNLIEEQDESLVIDDLQEYYFVNELTDSHILDDSQESNLIEEQDESPVIADLQEYYFVDELTGSLVLDDSLESNLIGEQDKSHVLSDLQESRLVNELSNSHVLDDSLESTLCVEVLPVSKVHLEQPIPETKFSELPSTETDISKINDYPLSKTNDLEDRNKMFDQIEKNNKLKQDNKINLKEHKLQLERQYYALSKHARKMYLQLRKERLEGNTSDSSQKDL